jgi:sugar/nucleoside kinase (ribokinase family)
VLQCANVLQVVFLNKTQLLQQGKAPEEMNAEELRDVVSYACAAAGLSTTKSGGIPSIPEYADVLEIQKKLI